MKTAGLHSENPPQAKQTDNKQTNKQNHHQHKLQTRAVCGGWGRRLRVDTEVGSLLAWARNWDLLPAPQQEGEWEGKESEENVTCLSIPNLGARPGAACA